MMNIKNTEMK